jgi:hypothetical protein
VGIAMANRNGQAVTKGDEKKHQVQNHQKIAAI